MKKLFALLLVGIFSLGALSFAQTPVEQKADELRAVVKLILNQSKDKQKDTQFVKALFAWCEQTCSDPTIKEAAKLINTTFDKDFWLTATEAKNQTYKLIEVVDWDTVRIEKDGQVVSVRMIGLDAPESTTTRYGHMECFWKEASNHLAQLLSGVSQIELEVDPTQTATDKYWRLLGYVIANGVNMNQKMIEDGYGFEYTYNLPYKYQSEFKAAQKIASEKKFGLWADVACKGERKAIEEESKKETEKPWSSEDNISKEEYFSYKTYYTWPKWGCYYWSGNDKVYVDRSYCWRSTSTTTSSSYSSYSDSSTGRICYTGPRGGRYYYNSKGKKVYGC